MKNLLNTHKKNSKIYKKCLKQSIVLFTKSQQIVTALHSVYLDLQKGRTSKKGLTEKETDVLRAMLIFSASGLDSVLKQLVKDTLLLSAKKNQDVQMQLENFIEKKLKQRNSEGKELLDYKILSRILVHQSPFEQIVNINQKDLTAGSLQSADEILKIAAAFAVTQDQICTDIKLLKEIFVVRNQIIHEQDIDLQSTKNRRRPRTHKMMIEYSNLLMSVSSNFIEIVNTRL